MRIYMGGTTRPKLRKARQLAPSHCFGVTWTPSDRRLNEIPFFVDNGAFTSSFDPDEWVDLLDKLEDYNYGPDFVVLPDEYNDAKGTMARHREWASEVLDRGLPPAAVIQPGMPVGTQVRLADKIGADFVFVGGATRWKRACGRDIVEEAHARDLAVHIGRPDGEDGLPWTYKIGADSADTSTIDQNGYWHYLERLEKVTQDHSKGDGPIKDTRQSQLVTDGSGCNGRDVSTDTDYGGDR
ncbi:hypothetical protein [Natrinema thermotolerans]